MALELTSVADDEAVLWDGPVARRYAGLEPGTEQVVEGLAVRTLVRPPGERLATLATVNDVHFGETVCGQVAGMDLDWVLRSEPGEEPYPLVANRAAAVEIAALGPDAVVAKGDLTSAGLLSEYQEFESVYRTAFGSRLVVTRGNHDNPGRIGDQPVVPRTPAVQEVVLAGVIVAVLDTSRPGLIGGQLDAEQASWLDELAARADRPVLAMGHHPPWNEHLALVFGSAEGSGLDDPSLGRLSEVVARRPRIAAYLAGHTHRNAVRHLAATGPFPWVEVASVKDFPGSWAEYRVFEGGILQVHRRIQDDPAAVAWSERCRSLYGGLYPAYALGELAERCFEIPLREGVG